MFNPFKCMSCYINDWCEILSYIESEDCDGIQQRTWSTINIVKYWISNSSKSYIDQFKTEDGRYITKTLFIDNVAISSSNKLRIDGIIYDIVGITPVKISNKIIYNQIDVQIWSL